MYLQIPIKLEQYVDEIRRHSATIAERNKFTLIRLAVSETTNSKRLVYLLYNPYPSELIIDPLFFTRSSNIFKLYPAQFTVAPNSAVSFVAYVSSGDEIRINESKLINEYKDKIHSRYNKRYQYVENEIFMAQNNAKIQVKDIDFENTTYLDPSSVTHILDEDIIDYQTRYESYIDISLLDIKSLDDYVCFHLRFENAHDSLDIRINNYRLKIFDLETKLFVNVDTSFVLKKNSYKQTQIYLNKLEFSQIDTKNMQLKVTLL